MPRLLTRWQHRLPQRGARPLCTKRCGLRTHASHQRGIRIRNNCESTQESRLPASGVRCRHSRDSCVDSELLHMSQDSDPSLHGKVLYSRVRSSRFMIAGASRQQPNAGRR
jgi:hypothetical protein